MFGKNIIIIYFNVIMNMTYSIDSLLNIQV